MVFDFVDGGAEDEVTLRRNRRAFEDLVFRPRALVDVSSRDLSTSILDHDLSLPVIFGPAGLQGLVHRRGELAAAGAASEAGTVYVMSFGSSYSMEDIRAAADGPLWLQLSPWKHRHATESMLERAAAADYTAVCLTVDVAVGGRRDRDLRNGMTLPFRMTPRVAADVVLRPGWIPTAYANLRRQFGNFQEQPTGRGGAAGVAEWVAQNMNASATWEEVRWFRDTWPGRLLVKGIQRADDAQRARDNGVDGVIVSNHGGRQLDGARASIEVLPEVASAVGKDVAVLVDGGIRRGSDVVKALTLGADAVLITRPYVLALAFGDDGPQRVLELLRLEIDTTLALLGATSVRDIDPSLVERHL